MGVVLELVARRNEGVDIGGDDPSEEGGDPRGADRSSPAEAHDHRPCDEIRTAKHEEERGHVDIPASRREVEVEPSSRDSDQDVHRDEAAHAPACECRPPAPTRTTGDECAYEDEARDAENAACRESARAEECLDRVADPADREAKNRSRPGQRLLGADGVSAERQMPSGIDESRRRDGPADDDCERRRPCARRVPLRRTTRRRTTSRKGRGEPTRTSRRARVAARRGREPRHRARPSRRTQSGRPRRGSPPQPRGEAAAVPARLRPCVRRGGASTRRRPRPRRGAARSPRRGTADRSGARRR